MGNQSCGKYTLDSASLYAGRLPVFGDYWEDGAYAGAFLLGVYCSANSYKGWLKFKQYWIGIPMLKLNEYEEITGIPF